MSTLYVTEPGTHLAKEYSRLLVVKEQAVLLAVPLARVSHVVLVGNVGVTTPALHALLAAQVGVSLLNQWGDLLGQLTPPTGKNIALRRLQYDKTADASFCLALTRAVVSGKLRMPQPSSPPIARPHGGGCYTGGADRQRLGRLCPSQQHRHLTRARGCGRPRLVCPLAPNARPKFGL